MPSSQGSHQRSSRGGDDARPTVSVVLCVRDGAGVIRRQLAALEAQTGNPPFEVIVVDNGSTDATNALVREWIDSGAFRHGQARLITAGDPPGIPRGRNTGSLAARAHIVAFCDADDAVEPGWIAAIAHNTPRSGMLGGHARAVDSHGNPRPEVTVNGLIESSYLPFAPGCNFAVTQDCLRAVAGFDETLPPYGFDDVDFSWRVQEAGFPLVYCHEAAVQFTVSGRLSSVKKQYLSAKARMGVVARHPGYADKGHTMLSSLTNLGREVVLLPKHMVLPGARSRATHLRFLVSAAGFVHGVFTYMQTQPSPRAYPPP